MSTPADPTSVISAATGDMSDQLLSVAGVGLGIGVTIFVLRKGWRLLKGFTS
jgi:LPXTG-motif cell wall-anchored protein